jgi:hypothetical protein
MGCVVGETLGNGSGQVPLRTGLHATHSRLTFPLTSPILPTIRASLNKSAKI